MAALRLDQVCFKLILTKTVDYLNNDSKQFLSIFLHFRENLSWHATKSINQGLPQTA